MALATRPGESWLKHASVADPMAKLTKRKPGSKHQRWEKRFLPRSTTSPTLVYGLGGLGALGLGGGFWGQFGSYLHKAPEDFEAWQYAPWLLAAGAIITGVAIWIGTSGAASVRVGSGGVAEERGQGRRIAWWAIESITLQNGALVVKGTGETGDDETITLSLAALPEAAALTLKEASTRVGDKITLSAEERETVPASSKSEGESITPAPLQLVGKRCSKSDKVIAYEPDARVCPRCERVYRKESVPKTCACGASLAHLRGNQDKASPEVAESDE